MNTRKRYSWSGNPCVRINKLNPDEEHPCYYCGFPLPIDNGACAKCGFLICPNCKRCVCNGDYASRTALIHLRERYCCNLENFEKGMMLMDLKYLELVPHFRDALDYCRRKEGAIS